MIYKITPKIKCKGDEDLKPKFVSINDSLENVKNNIHLVLEIGKIWLNGHENIELVNPKDPEFIEYAKSDINKLAGEIAKKEMLIEELKELLKEK